MHFSPALYSHVVHTLKLPLIVIMNKCDLTTPDKVYAWRKYVVVTLQAVWTFEL